MKNIYEKSKIGLIKYIKNQNARPSKLKWNRHAVENDFLSTETIEYIEGIKFNKLCRLLIKKIHKNMI